MNRIIDLLPAHVMLQADLLSKERAAISLVDTRRGYILDCEAYTGKVDLENVGEWVEEFKESLREAGVV